jgi:mono/diheme cytochrome c family protein
MSRMGARVAAAALVAWRLVRGAPLLPPGQRTKGGATDQTGRAQTPQRSRWGRRAVVAVAALLVAALGGLGFIYSGIFDVAASRQHTPVVYWALITSLRQSVHVRAGREVGPAPDLSGRARFERGLVFYDLHCLQCHGAPGVPMRRMGQSLTPAPANLVKTGRDWSSQEIFWTVKHGLKMTGMPAWGHFLTEDDMWSIVAFVKTMPSLSPAEYKRRRATLVLMHTRVEAEP